MSRMRVTESHADLHNRHRSYRKNTEDVRWLRTFVSTGWLLQVIILGNYVTPSHEEDYKQALLREYRKFRASMESEGEGLAGALKEVKRDTYV